EIDAGAEAEILVARPGVAVDAAVLAAPVGVQAEAEADVRAVVLRQHAAARVTVVRRGHLAGRAVWLDVERLVPVGRITAGAARRPRRLGHFALSSPSRADVARAFAQRSRIRTPTHSTSPTTAPMTTPGIGCLRQTKPPATAPSTTPGQPMSSASSVSCCQVNSILMSDTRPP